MMMVVKGLVDTREPANVRQFLINLGWLEQALPCDYWWKAKGHTFGVCYKANDLYASFINREKGSGLHHLKSELIRLLDYVDVPILAYQGLPDISKDNHIVTNHIRRPIKWKALARFLRSWQERGVRVIEVPRSDRRPHIIIEIADYYSKLFHTGADTTLEFKYKADRRLLSLMSIPKVSKMKAGLLLESFGNLGNIAKATEEELTSINGIGPTLGRNIYDYWR